MNKLRRQIENFCLVYFLFLIPSIGVSQDIQYSQFYANVLYLNPAFAGNAHATRGVFHQRLQWPSLDAKYITSHFSIDTYFSKLNSGIGIMFHKDWQGANTIASNDLALQYAYELHLSSRYAFRAGVQASYVTRSINYAVLYFPDQYDANGYLGSLTSQPNNIQNIQYLDISSGCIFYSENYWLGLTYSHMNRPNQTFYGGTSKLPYKMDFTAGYRIDLKDNNQKIEDKNKNVYLTPTFHYKSIATAQSSFSQTVADYDSGMNRDAVA